MKYRVVEATSCEVLGEIVNKLISEGWEPTGGVSISLSESDEYEYFVAAQTMIKR